MRNITNRIKEAMQQQEMTRADLAKKTNLSIDTVSNVLYGKSKKYDHVYKIAEILNIDLNKDILLCYEILAEKPPFNITINSRATTQLNKSLAKQGIQVSKDIFDTMLEVTYNFILKNDDPSDQAIEIFIMGMINFSLALQSQSKHL